MYAAKQLTAVTSSSDARPPARSPGALPVSFLLVSARRGGHVALDVAAQLVALLLIVHAHVVEPLEEATLGPDAVHLRRRLQQQDLRQHLELASLLVEVDESLVGRVAARRVEHHQVGEECAQVRDRALNDWRLKT